MESTPEKKFAELLAIIKKLRAPDGCPWDRRQTVDSFRPYLVEELYELLEAMDEEDAAETRDELGDMFFQLLFLANLYEEQGTFTAADALKSICDKMLRRHPHVFGDMRGAAEEDIRRNWKKIKEEEKRARGASSAPPLAVPAAMPALAKAHKVSSRAARTGFEWPDIDSVFAKLEEEIAEMREAVKNGDREEMLDELGDILFVTVNLARKAGLDSETALNRAVIKFIRRFTGLCRIVEEEKEELAGMDFGRMVELWQRAKSETGTGKYEEKNAAGQ